MDSNRLFNDTISAGYSTHNQLEAWRLEDELSHFHSLGTEIPLFGIATGEPTNSIPDSAAQGCVSDFNPLLRGVSLSSASLGRQTKPRRKSVTPINLLLHTEDDSRGFDRLPELNRPNGENPSNNIIEPTVTLKDIREAAPSSAIAAPLKVFYDDCSDRSVEELSSEAIPEARSLFRRIDPPHVQRENRQETNVYGQKAGQFDVQSESALYKFADRFLDPAHERTNADFDAVQTAQTETRDEPETKDAPEPKLNIVAESSDASASDSNTVLAFPANVEYSSMEPPKAKSDSPSEAAPAASASAASPAISASPSISAETVNTNNSGFEPVQHSVQNTAPSSGEVKTSAVAKERRDSFLMSFRWPLCYMGAMALSTGAGIMGYSLWTNHPAFLKSGLSILSAGGIGLGCAAVLQTLHLIGSAVSALTGKRSPKRAETTGEANDNSESPTASDQVVEMTPAVLALEQQARQLQSVLNELQRQKAA